MGEGSSSELGRHGSIGKCETERLDVGPDAPLQSRDPEVPELAPTHSCECFLLRESFDSLGGLATKEGCAADHDLVGFLIAVQEQRSDILDMV